MALRESSVALRVKRDGDITDAMRANAKLPRTYEQSPASAPLSLRFFLSLRPAVPTVEF